jgi:hypothetical protein
MSFMDDFVEMEKLAIVSDFLWIHLGMGVAPIGMLRI